MSVVSSKTLFHIFVYRFVFGLGLSMLSVWLLNITYERGNKLYNVQCLLYYNVFKSVLPFLQQTIRSGRNALIVVVAYVPRSNEEFRLKLLFPGKKNTSLRQKSFCSCVFVSFVSLLKYSNYAWQLNITKCKTNLRIEGILLLVRV